MFCKNCGNNLDDNAQFCGKCGTDLKSENYDSSVPPPIVTPVSSEKKKATFTLNCLIPKMFVLIGIICFFFPFMSVSCAGEKVDIFGIHMIIDNEETSSKVKNYSDDEKSSLFNIFVTASGICAIIALFSAKKAGFLSALLLIIFRLSAKSYYSIGEKRLSELEDILKIEFGPALWIAIIAFIVAAVSNYIIRQKE